MTAGVTSSPELESFPWQAYTVEAGLTHKPQRLTLVTTCFGRDSVPGGSHVAAHSGCRIASGEVGKDQADRPR